MGGSGRVARQRRPAGRRAPAGRRRAYLLTTRRAAAGLALALLAGGGCTPAGTPAARAAAATFQSAVAARDGRAACALLAPQARSNLESASSESCPAALRALDLPAGQVRSVAVWGDNAQVRTGPGVLFLARFRAGWLVTGAGCEPQPGRPYDCEIEN